MKKISTRVLLNHPKVRVVEDDVVLPDGTYSNYLRFEYHNKAAMVIAKRTDGKIAVGRELSYPTGKRLYQFPGGGSNTNESLKAAAQREFLEETGYCAKKLKKIGHFYIDNRRSDMSIAVYYAEASKCQKVDTGDEYDLELFWFSEFEINKFISAGKIVNPTMLAGWAIYSSA